MSQAPMRTKCRCCGNHFIPDARNATRQHYCVRPQCRQASKVASRRRWLRKRGNGDHFRGDEEVRRVQRWRVAHPGYWRKSGVPKASQTPVPEPSPSIQESRNVPRGLPGTLQESYLPQDPMLVGLVSMITGGTLQDDIEEACRNLIARGCEILRSKGATIAPLSGPRSAPGAKP